MEIKANTLEKWKQHVDLLQLSDKDLVKKLLTSNRIFRLLVNNFLTRRWACCCYFQGICFKSHANLTGINGNIKKILPELRGFWQAIILLRKRVLVAYLTVFVLWLIVFFGVSSLSRVLVCDMCNYEGESCDFKELKVNVSSVSPDRGPSCLQKLSADYKSRR